tara:strand:- start:878 stop:1573 length:696 start_codon:yes stop_codon:yes gene_type:complete
MTILFNYNSTKKMGVIYDPDLKIVRKFINGRKSQILLKNEKKGFKWYQSRRQLIFNKSIKIINSKKNYLDFPIFKGKQKKFWDYLEINYEEAEIVVKQYQKLWPNKKKVPCHGDLVFSNVIFTKNSHPIIIDWENFLYSNIWGFDLCYFLVSTIALPSIFNKDQKIKENELILFENLWKKAFENKKYIYLKKPVNFLKSKYGLIFKKRKYLDYYPNKLSSYIINQINEAAK